MGLMYNVIRGNKLFTNSLNVFTNSQTPALGGKKTRQNGSNQYTFRKLRVSFG